MQTQVCSIRRFRQIKAIHFSDFIVPRQTSKRGSLEELTSKLISVTEASQLSGLMTSYVRRLIRAGRIKGVKIGRNWLTTEQAIRDYLSEERRPGRPRRE